MTECGSCGEASRADTLLEPHHPNPDALKRDELQDLLFEVQPPCPACGNQAWSEVKAQNLMFNTTIGLAIQDAQVFATGNGAGHVHLVQRCIDTSGSAFRSVRCRLAKGTGTKSLLGKA